MSAENHSTPVDSQHYQAGGEVYDLTVFHRGSGYYAVWYCRQCLTRTETEECHTIT